MRTFLAEYNKITNIMSKSFKIKTLAICAILFAGIIFPATLTAQRNDAFFKIDNEDLYDNRATENVTLGNDPFGEKPVPVGSGLLVLTIAGAGYAIARRKRSLRKGTTLLLALALVMGMTQCKKRVETVVSDPDNMIHITLNVGNSSRHEIIPNEDGYVPVRYLVGDVVYVGNGTSYIGTLTCTDASDADGNNASFEGDIIAPNIDDVLHFYFVGGLTPSTTLTAGTTTDFTVDISNQSSKLPVLSYTYATYNGSNSISCNLHNKCALVEFVLDTKTGLPVKACNMLSEAKIDFANPGITPTGVVDAITLYPLSSDYTIEYKKKWAILLPGDARNSVARITTDTYAGEQYDYYDYDGVPSLSDCDYIYGNNAIAIHNNAAPTTKKLFVVSANGNVVQFSPGNLQYQASTQTWRFAQHPWDVVGNDTKGNVYETIGGVPNVKCNNALIGDNYEGWIDLFGWGTWGEGRNPSLHTDDNADYIYSSDFNGVIDQDNHDDWRLLASEEWRQLQIAHHNNSSLMGKGKITDSDGAMLGLIILPQKTEIEGFKPFDSQLSTINNLTMDEWESDYKPKGAVFLPYPSGRNGASVWNYVNKRAYYWSKTPYDGSNAYYADASASDGISANGTNFPKKYGFSIRLVR